MIAQKILGETSKQEGVLINGCFRQLFNSYHAVPPTDPRRRTVPLVRNLEPDNVRLPAKFRRDLPSSPPVAAPRPRYLHHRATLTASCPRAAQLKDCGLRCLEPKGQRGLSLTQLNILSLHRLTNRWANLARQQLRPPIL